MKSTPPTKILWYGLSLLILGCLACIVIFTRNAEKRLIAQIDSAVQAVLNGKTQVLDLKSAAGFEWNTLHLFGPYASAEMIETDLGFSWPGINKTRIASNDSVCLLVFLKGGQVAGHCEFPRKKGDFTPASGSARLTGEEAEFTVKRGEDGGIEIRVLNETA